MMTGPPPRIGTVVFHAPVTERYVHNPDAPQRPRHHNAHGEELFEPMTDTASRLHSQSSRLLSIVLAHVGHVEEAIAERGYNVLQDDSL